MEVSSRVEDRSEEDSSGAVGDGGEPPAIEEGSGLRKATEEASGTARNNC